MPTAKSSQDSPERKKKFDFQKETLQNFTE